MRAARSASGAVRDHVGGTWGSSYQLLWYRSPWTISATALLVGISIAASAGALGPLLGLVHRVPGADTTLHFLLYGSLAFVVTSAALRGDAGSRRRRLGLSVVALLAFVTVDELLQLLLPLRAFDFSDLGANVVGIAVFTAVAWWRDDRRR